MRSVSLRVGRLGFPWPAPQRFRQGVLVIGRADGSDLQLQSPGVSRRHCRLLVEEERVLVEDLGSRHGTSVDGTPLQVGVPFPLAEGSIVRIEHFLLEVSLLPEEAPAGATVRRRSPRPPEPPRLIPVLHPVDAATPPPPGACVSLSDAAPRPSPATPDASCPDLLAQLGPEFVRRLEQDAHAVAATLDALSRASR